MKRMIIAAMALLMVLWAGVAGAETYEVKKGDWLSKIGQKTGISWQKIYEANKKVIGENPNLIRPGQKLEIPIVEPAKVKKAEKAKPFLWKKPAANPFGEKRIFAKAIAKFNLPEEVKKAFIAKVKAGEFEWDIIEVGDHFEQMTFGDYKVINNVIAAWPDALKLLAARLYQAEFEGRIYSLFDPLICNNWAWRVEEKKAEEKPPVPPPPPAEVAPPPPPPAEPEKEPMFLLLIPPPAQPAEPVQPAEPSVPLSYSAWVENALDMSVFAGVSERTQGEGRGGYWGVDANLYLIAYEVWGGKLEIGPSVQYVGWQGWDYDTTMAANGHWRGHKELYGVGSRFKTENTETTAKLRFGTKEGEFHISQYRNEERNRLGNLELYHTRWFEERTWFHDVELGLRADVDLGGDKDSSWEGSKIPSGEDPRSDQSEYALSVKTELYKGRVATPTLGVSGVYAEYNDYNGNNWFLVPQVGVKLFEDVVAVNAEYQIREGSGNNAAGIGVVVEIEKVFTWIKNGLKSRNNGEEKSVPLNE